MFASPSDWAQAYVLGEMLLLTLVAAPAVALWISCTACRAYRKPWQWWVAGVSLSCLAALVALLLFMAALSVRCVVAVPAVGPAVGIGAGAYFRAQCRRE